MRLVLSRLLWQKLLATVLAVGVFVYLYEVTSNDAVWPWQAQQPVDPTTPVPGSRVQFSATAYCKGDTTASGVAARSGIAAADPSLLPVGSVVTVTTDQEKYNGVYTVMDTGPEVKGRELDLYLWSCTEALAFGRKQVQVTVLRLGWSPAASTPSLIDRLFRRRAAKVPAAPSAITATPSTTTPVPPSTPAAPPEPAAVVPPAQMTPAAPPGSPANTTP